MENIFSIKNFIAQKDLTDKQLLELDNLQLIRVLFYKKDSKLYLEFKNSNALSFALYESFIDYISSFFPHEQLNIEIKIITDFCDLNISDLKAYIDHFFINKKIKIFHVPTIASKQCILKIDSESEIEVIESNLKDLKDFLIDCGIDYEVSCQLNDEQHIFEVGTVKVKMEEEQESKNFETKKIYSRKTKNSEYNLVTIDDLAEELDNNVSFYGDIFKIETRETKINTLILTLYVEDETNAVIVKAFEGKNFNKEFLNSIKVKNRYKFSGNYRFDDRFSKDYCFFAETIEAQPNQELVIDDAEIKRVELDTHSNRSEMDSVCDVEEIVKAAFKMGHKGVAITDHMNVQSFPKAQRTVRNLLKANPDREFKMLYGVQFNLVNERLNIVRNPNDNLLKDLEYVVFDLETTGLSMHYDYVIEFGAVVYKNGMEVSRHDFFVKPPIEIPVFIQNVTNIKNSDVENARTFKECIDEIKGIVKDRVLVAHNASFDIGFLNEELRRNGHPEFTNTVIDTLDLSRSLFKDRRSYRLGNLARIYGVNYDEEVAHRADYDAEVLAKVFNYILLDLYKKDVYTLNQLSNFQSEDAFVKNFASHANVIVKNKQGLKDLFKLVSISNTEQLAVFGKANSKSESSEFMAEPRLFKTTLNQFRTNLLIGSSTNYGEVFEAAAFKTSVDLKKAISYYDYIEIQPLENYRPLVESTKILDNNRLKDIIKRIIHEAQIQNKLIVATGDVRYVLAKQKILRDVYINTPGIGGARHQLFIYDKQKRASNKTPMQRFLNTKEMLKEFEYLDDPNLINRMVIENPCKILEMCDYVYPIHDGLFPPKIENSDQLLTDIVNKKAFELYGENPDSIIKARIERELNSILSNGYGVVYYVSHLLVKKSNDDGYLVGSRGSVGSSIIATLAGITEVNPLKPHYRCPKCKFFQWVDDCFSGYNLPDKTCPNCQSLLIGDGQDIPFETFLGFEGDKVPDIDLNFSSEYQDKAHLFTREVFGPDHVFRAGTISTVAEKTAYGYVRGYCEEMNILNMSKAMKERLASGCENVKRTTGQHPGGIIVIPQDMDVYDFTPIQYPANSLDATWKTTHFDFHEIHDNVLKFDILGHVDPTAMKLLENISGIDPKNIPMNDEKVMSIFNSPKELKIINRLYQEETGACGLPEFGTRFVRGILELTRPNTFSDLVQISGLSHGTDVWNNNAKELIENENIKLKEVIGCRDDIMSTLIRYNIPSKTSFTIMECVRKGKGLTPDQEELMLANNVPKWYIESCKKIKYMFPKAHAVAYVIMAIRVAWFKVYHPIFYYISFFSLRCTAYEIESMIKDAAGIKARMEELMFKMNSKDPNNMASKKERDLYDTLEICFEMVCRGYRITNIDLNLSYASKFRVNPNNDKEIIPPFVVLDGLGEAAAQSIVDAREEREFLSKEDLMNRTQVSKTIKDKLEKLGVLIHLDDSNQLSLF